TNATQREFGELFRLDEDLGEITAEIASKAPELKPYICAIPGLRVMKPSDVVEETFCFLCTANNNLKRILQMVRALATEGEPMDEVEEVTVHRFPTIEVIAALDEHELRAKGFGYRARTIPSIARQIVERGGEEWLKKQKEAPYADAHRRLTGIAGIGPKLADCICLFALHHTEAVPVDTHLWQAATRHYFPQWKGKSLTDVRYRAVGDHFRDRFGALAGWAHQYLFYDNMMNWREYRKR
ncbi:MAG TPA: hypothetical protein VNI20_08840, partial [Fimbriimonadaceae bacterium]|nr:hypothetical protein [Fimbriimonadaceae bacterium]